MNNKPNIWVVAGLPGSGKSTIANELIQSGDFEGFEVSTNYAEIIERLGPQKLYYIMDEKNFPSADARINAFSEYMKELHGAVCDVLEQAELPESHLPPDFIAMCTRMALLPLSDFVKFVLGIFFKDPLICAMFFNFYNTINVQNKAVKRAKEQPKPILLTGAYFKTPHARNEIKAFLKSQKITSQLLIVRSTRERLFEVAEERKLDPNVDPGRVLIETYLKYPPVSIHENWDNIVVVNNSATLENAVIETRRRLAHPGAFHFSQDIPLVYEPRIKLK